MAKLDELIEEYRSEGRDEDAEELEKLRGSTLREKAKRADELEKKAAELEAKVAALELAPKREKALKEYGVDLEGLSKAERKIVEQYDGEMDEESIGKLVEEFELPTVDGGNAESEGEEASAAERVAQAARNSAAGRGSKAPVIKPGDVSGWSMDKKVSFADEHPTEWETLKRGETVTGVAV